MGIRFSKSNSSASHGTSNGSTTRQVNTKVNHRHSAPVARSTTTTTNSSSNSSSSSIAIPLPSAQELNFQIEEYPHGAIAIHNQHHNLSDISSLSSTNSACRRVIIKIQLAKMENNGNETPVHSCGSNYNNNVFTHQASSRLAETTDCNANPIEVNVTLTRSNDNDELTRNAWVDDVVACRTAGSFVACPVAGPVAHRHTLPAVVTATSSDQLEQSTSQSQSKGVCSAGTDARTSSQLTPIAQQKPASSAHCTCSNCASSGSTQEVTQYVESTSMNRHCCRNSHSSRDSVSPMALTAASSDRSSPLSGSDQVSIWTPNNNEVIIQSQQFVVLCPQASLVTLSRVNENFVRGVVAAEMVGTLDSTPGLSAIQSPNVFSLGTPNGITVHSQVDFVHHLVPDLDKITNSSFYWGKMDRYEAERLLEGKPEGTFLLRDSAQEEFLFSVTFRKYNRSLHARIEQSGHKFSFDCHDPCVFTASTVTGLLEHYKDPACVMFFEPMLTVPLHRTMPFSLQQLCRASIVSNITYDGINKLELPMRLKSYLKEYHYKQKLRTKPCDEVIFPSI